MPGRDSPAEHAGLLLRIGDSEFTIAKDVAGQRLGQWEERPEIEVQKYCKRNEAEKHAQTRNSTFLLVVMKDGGETVRMRIGDGWDVDIYKAMILAVEEDAMALIPA